MTFFRLKPGHLLLPGRLIAGRSASPISASRRACSTSSSPRLSSTSPRSGLRDFRWPTAAGHKYARGHAVVVSGPLYSTGAARLGARGALRVGAGLVTVASPARRACRSMRRNLPPSWCAKPTTRAGWRACSADERKNAVLIGPGIGVGERTKDDGVWRRLAPMAAVVLDADAITILRRRLRQAVRGNRRRAAPVVLTPHDGEFARLFGDSRPPPKLDAGAPSRGPLRRNPRAQRRRYRRRRPRRQSLDQRHHEPLAGDGRQRRRARRHDARAARSRHAGLRRGERRPSGCMARRRRPLARA